MSAQRDLGALQIAESTFLCLVGLISAMSDDVAIGREDLLGLVVDANVLALDAVTPFDRAMSSYVKWAETKGMPRPRPSGVAARLGLLEQFA